MPASGRQTAGACPMNQTNPRTGGRINGGRRGQHVASAARSFYCGVEQRLARLAHNQEVAGSSPAPATFVSDTTDFLPSAPVSLRRHRGFDNWSPRHASRSCVAAGFFDPHRPRHRGRPHGGVVFTIAPEAPSVGSFETCGSVGGVLKPTSVLGRCMPGNRFGRSPGFDDNPHCERGCDGPVAGPSGHGVLNPTAARPLAAAA